MIRRQRILIDRRTDGGTWMAAPVRSERAGIRAAIALALPEADPAAMHHARTRLLTAARKAATATPGYREGDER